MTLTDAERGWVAGIIDGEGCLIINRQEPGRWGRKSPSHRLYLKVTMGHEPTINRLHSLTGHGSVHHHPGTRWNDSWSWIVAVGGVRYLLDEIQPLLVTKAAEAEVAREFLSIPTVRLDGPLSPATIAARQDCFERIRDLKPSSRFRRTA
jgi:hypothetical protein